MSGLAFPKPRPAALDRADRRKLRAKLDEAQNRLVKKRSGGRCEVVFAMPAWTREVTRFAAGQPPDNRCSSRAVHVHHRIGGWGKRARGASVLASNKLHVCAACHQDIHSHVLVPEGEYFRRLR